MNHGSTDAYHEAVMPKAFQSRISDTADSLTTAADQGTCEAGSVVTGYGDSPGVVEAVVEEQALTKREQAEARHAEALDLCNKLAGAKETIQMCWARLGYVAFVVDRDKDFLQLGLNSFGEWAMKLENDSTYGRSSIYKFKEIVSILLPDIPLDKLECVHPGNAGFLAFDVKSSSVRKDPVVLQQAQSDRGTTKLFKMVTKAFPDQLIERKHFETLAWAESAWSLIAAEVERTREEEDEPEMKLADVLELWANHRREGREIAQSKEEAND
jgi:hypothetical protein